MNSFNISFSGLLASILLTTLIVGNAHAAELAGGDIKKAVSGKTVHVSTAVGSLPIKFRSNGTMRARSSAVASVTGVGSDKGRWWVSGRRLCQKWTTWLKGKTHCVTLRRNGKKLVWTSASGRKGSARVSSR